MGRDKKNKKRRKRRTEGVLELYLVLHLAGWKQEWIWSQRKRQLACYCCKSCPEEQIEEEEEEGEGNDEKQLETEER